MNFSEALKHIDKCRQAWESLKSTFGGREREILEDSYLVVSHPRGQLSPAEFNPTGIAENHSVLLFPCEQNQELLRLIRKKEGAAREIVRQQGILRGLNIQIERLNKSMIQLHEFTVEVRFNQLDFELIRKLKHSEFCDKSKTDMSDVSIRVVLKGFSDG